MLRSPVLLFVSILTIGALAEYVRAQPVVLSPVLHAQLLERAEELPRLRSLLVSIDGALVLERYFHGARAGQPANLKSVSKSVLSALVGIALDRGDLMSLQEPIGRFFPQYLGDPADPRKKNITIEDLLTMRSGLESTSNVNYGAWVQSHNWVRHALARPMVDEPGGRMIYSTGNSHLLSALLTKAARMSTYEFARRYLAEPLKARLEPWTRDPQGIYLGGNEMQWTPRAILAFGNLYLSRGRAHGKRVVSERWVDESIRPRARSSWSGREYGYGWWIDRLAGHAVYFAWGHGGQFVFVLPSLKMVVVTTSTPVPGRGRREHQHAIYDLMKRYLVPAADGKSAAAKELPVERPA